MKKIKLDSWMIPRMNPYRETMIEEGGNICWCRPYRINVEVDGKPDEVFCCLNEGSVEGVTLGDEFVDGKLEILRKIAKFVNEDFDDYSLETDPMEIIKDSLCENHDWEECDCRDCPAFCFCDAMDEEDSSDDFWHSKKAAKERFWYSWLPKE